MLINNFNKGECRYWRAWTMFGVLPWSGHSKYSSHAWTGPEIQFFFVSSLGNRSFPWNFKKFKTIFGLINPPGYVVYGFSIKWSANFVQSFG